MGTCPADDGTGAPARAAPNDGAGAGSAEAELVADFTSSAIFCAAPSSRARPNSLASIERRWFVGKQTKRSADALAAGLLGDDQEVKISQHFVLIGTVALLQLARAGHHVIQAKEPRGEGQHLEITIHVPTMPRGRPRKDATEEARLMPSRVYFVNPKLAALCEEALDRHSSALPGLLQEERGVGVAPLLSRRCRVVARARCAERPTSCEGCGIKHASYGLPSERKKRWCGVCGKPRGAVSLVEQHIMCEGCGVKQARYGTPAEGKVRWCSGCGKPHGVVNLTQPMCEGCDIKQARFGTPSERKRRWCGACGKPHGAVDLKRHKVTGRVGAAATPCTSLGEHSVEGQRAIYDLAALAELAVSRGAPTTSSSFALNFATTEQLVGHLEDSAIKHESSATS